MKPFSLLKQIVLILSGASIKYLDEFDDFGSETAKNEQKRQSLNDISREYVYLTS